jgi:hypothetical protein
MIARLLFVAILFLTACGQIKSTPENKTVDTVQGPVKDTVITNTLNSSPDNAVSSKKRDTPFNCEEALHALVNSSFRSELKQFGFKVFVDTVNADSAILEITHRNEERGDDVPIGWLKIDFNKNQLFDLSGDSDKPVELTYDTILYQKIIRNCR